MKSIYSPAAKLGIRRLVFVLAGLVLLMQFNNCSGMNSSLPFDNLSQLTACDPPDPSQTFNSNAPAPNTNCTLPDQQNLAIQPGPVDPVASGIQQIQIGGTCNAGAYPLNVIRWALNLSNASGLTLVRTSDMIYNGQAWNGKCVNGRFTVWLNLLPTDSGYASEDTSDRSGLVDPTTGLQTSGYSLDITITGYDSTGQPYLNAINGTQTVNLTPL
jgi:hypothetical protein